MTLLFLILLLLLALAVQMRVFQCSLKMLRSDYWPERKIVDPEDPFDVVVSVRNMSSHYVPFVKVEEFFGNRSMCSSRTSIFPEMPCGAGRSLRELRI